MKKLLLLLFIILINNLRAQYTRVLPEYNPILTSCYASFENSLDNRTFYFSQKSTNLLLNSISLSDQGDVLSYDSLSIPNLPGNNFYITNAFKINSSEVQLVCMSKDGSFAKQTFIRYNFISNTLVSFTTIANDYVVGAVKSRLIGDSILTYLSENSILKRISRHLQNINNFSEQDIPGMSIYSHNMTNGKYANNFIYKFGKEYVLNMGTNQNLLVYNSGSILLGDSPSLTSFLKWNLYVAQNQEIHVFVNDSLFKYNTSLNLLTTDYFPEMHSESVNYNREITDFNGDVFVAIQTEELKILKLSNTYQVLAIEDLPVYLSAIRFFNIQDEKLKIDGYSPQNLVFGSVGDNSLALIATNILFEIEPPYDIFVQFETDRLSFQVMGQNRLLSPADNSTAPFNFSNGTDTAATIFNSSNWLVGKNASDAILYSDNSQGEFDHPGPNILPGSNTLLNIWKYTRGYYITKEMVEQHLTIILYGNPGYVAPHAIRNWPVEGNVSLGEPAQLANFVDVNGNGIYEPYQGEYPKFYGDKCVLFISHDSEFSPLTTGTETHNYIYTFQCDSSELLERSVFLKQQRFARMFDLDSVYLVNYHDFDVGYIHDDYIGANVELSTSYIYNADNFDENNGVSGFQNKIPVQGFTFLSGAKQYDDALDNPYGVNLNESINGTGFGDGIIDNERWGLTASMYYNSGSPDSLNTPEIYYRAKGLFTDGTPQTVNGVNVKHWCFGNSDPLFYSSGGQDHGNNYSEITMGNPPGDRRMLSSTGPSRLHLNDTLVLDAVYLTSLDTINTTTVAGGLPNHFAEVSDLRNRFLNNNVGCGKTFGTISETLNNPELETVSSLLIYPNPFQDEITVANLEGNFNELKIYDLNGRLINTIDLKGMEQKIVTLENTVGNVFILQFVGNTSNEIRRVIKR